MEAVWEYGGINLFQIYRQFSRKYEREKLKPIKRTPEDEEIDACSFDYINQVIKMVRGAPLSFCKIPIKF